MLVALLGISASVNASDSAAPAATTPAATAKKLDTTWKKGQTIPADWTKGAGKKSSSDDVAAMKQALRVAAAMDLSEKLALNDAEFAEVEGQSEAFFGDSAANAVSDDHDALAALSDADYAKGQHANDVAPEFQAMIARLQFQNDAANKDKTFEGVKHGGRVLGTKHVAGFMTGDEAVEKAYNAYAEESAKRLGKGYMSLLKAGVNGLSTNQKIGAGVVGAAGLVGLVALVDQLANKARMRKALARMLGLSKKEAAVVADIVSDVQVS